MEVRDGGKLEMVKPKESQMEMESQMAGEFRFEHVEVRDKCRRVSGWKEALVQRWREFADRGELQKERRRGWRVDWVFHYGESNFVLPSLPN